MNADSIDPFAGNKTPCNTCYCKHCAYHCQLCFLQKGLGIVYGRAPRKRPRARQSGTPDQEAVSLSDPRRQQISQKKEKEKVETATGSSGGNIREDS
uniref:Protein Tat n=1 Tax=Simian immunodeficiency virus TaxID=11723 RepID=Q70IH0_SIV|nr:tat protein [Simian immunodeficiency virus]